MTRLEKTSSPAPFQLRRAGAEGNVNVVEPWRIRESFSAAANSAGHRVAEAASPNTSVTAEEAAASVHNVVVECLRWGHHDDDANAMPPNARLEDAMLGQAMVEWQSFNPIHTMTSELRRAIKEYQTARDVALLPDVQAHQVKPLPEIIGAARQKLLAAVEAAVFHQIDLL